MAENADENTIVFHYIKNPSYRQVHIDGCYGSLTPHGFININFYAERAPIPKSVKYDFPSDGKIFEEENFSSQDSLDGIIREIEFGGYLSVQGAIKLRDLLNETLDEYKGIVTKAQSSKDE